MGMSNGGPGVASMLDDRTRDACLHKLGDHYAAGRVTAEELDSRIQSALAAETEAELAAVIDDLDSKGDGTRTSGHPDAGSPTRSGRTATPVARWTLGILVIVAGGTLLAAVAPGPATVELAVGLAAGLLGFLTHWWLTRRSAAPTPAVEPPAPTRPRPLVLRDEEWRPEDSDEATIEAMTPVDPAVRHRPARPMGRGSGVIPTQRTGD